MADAFFRFGTDIEQTRRQIAAGLQGIATDLARTRGVGNVRMFDGLVTSAQAAANKAMAALGGIGAQMAKGQQGLTLAGGGGGLQQQYRALRQQAIAETTAASKGLGFNKSEIAAANRQVRTAIDALFKSIADQLAADQKLTRKAFLAGEVPGRGLAPDLRYGPNRARIATPAIQEIARIEALGEKATAPLQRRAAALRGQEGLKAGQAQQVVKDFNDAFAKDIREGRDIHRRSQKRLAQEHLQSAHQQSARLKEQSAVEKSIARNQAKVRRDEERAFRTAEREARKDRERSAAERVLADPTTKRLTGGRFINDGQVFRTGGAGMVLERNAAKMAKAFDDSTASILKRSRHDSLTQSFLGGLTSSGFGGNASGFDASGIARSFGSTVKFSAQYEALQMVQMAFIDTIREAVDYRDSLTDLNVALGEGEQASAAYVDQLSNISRLAGGNVGQALDAAARGIRAFTEPGDESSKKAAAGVASARQARDLSIITGQKIPDAMGDLVAIGQSFGIEIENLGRITDAVAAAKQQGGDPYQIAQGLANASVALNQAGFDAAEGAFLISSVIANLNESGQAAATRISRIVSSAGGTAGRSFFRSLDIDPNQDAKQSLIDLAQLQKEGALSASQMQRALNTLGGSSNLREFKAALDALDLDGFVNGFDTAGKAQSEVDRKTSDLAGHLKVLGGTMSNLQNEIFDSGAFAPFLAALATLQPTLQTAESLLKVFNELAETVLPDWKIGGVGIQDVLVGGLEIVAISKLLSSIRRRNAPETMLAASLEKDLAAAQAVQAKAAAAGVTASSAEFRARQVQITAIQAEIAAHNGLTVAKGRSAGVGVGGAAAYSIGSSLNAGRERLDAGKARAGTFLASTAGKATVAGVAIITAVQAINALRGAIEQNTTSREAGQNALNQLATGPAGESVEALRSAASERDKASSGITGNIVDFFNKLPSKLGGSRRFGDDAERDAKDLRVEADNELRRLKSRRLDDEEQRSSPQRFEDVMGDISSLESLKNAFEELDAGGASAARTTELLAEAFAGIANVPTPGEIKAGSARRVADDFSTTLFDSIEESLSARYDGKALRFPGMTPQEEKDLEDKGVFQTAQDRIREAAQERENARRKAENTERERQGNKEPQLSMLDRDKSGDRAEIDKLIEEGRKKEFGKSSFDSLKGFEVGKRSEIMEGASALLENFFNTELGKSGGFLTEAQIKEGATRVADFLIGQDGDLAKDRDKLIALLTGDLADKTTIAGLNITQDISDFLQSKAITTAQTANEQTTLETGDGVRGAQARVDTLAAEARRTRESGNELNDTFRLEQLRAQQDLIEAFESRRDAADELAKAVLGKDDEIGIAAIDVESAYRELAIALNSKSPQRIAQAQAEVIGALEGQREAIDKLISARDRAVIDPRNSQEMAAADVRDATRALNRATPGTTGFFEAQTALRKSQQAYADEVTQAETTALFNNIDPRDELALAAAAIEEQRIIIRNKKRGLPAVRGDYDTEGNLVGAAPDFEAKGEGVGAEWVRGVDSVDYFTTGANAARDLLAGINSIAGQTGVPGSNVYPANFVGPLPPGATRAPAGVNTTDKEITTTVVKVIGEREDGTLIKGPVEVKVTNPNYIAPLPAAAGGGNNSRLLLDLLKQSGLGYGSADGSVVDRNVAGTNTKSQHAFGNAVDIFGTPEQLAQIVGFLKQYATGLKELIYTPTNTFLGEGGKAFTPRQVTKDTHQDHIHVSVNDPNKFNAAVSSTGVQLPSTGGAVNTDADNQELVRRLDAERQLILAHSIANLQMLTDPNNSLDQARANLRIAEATARAQLAGSTAWKQAITQVRAAQLALSRAFIDRDNAKRNADAVRAQSGLASARSGLAAAERNLKAQAARTKEFYEAQAALYQAQQAYATAVRESEANVAMLASDITDPVEQAAIALKTATAAVAHVARNGGDVDARNAAELERRRAEVALEQSIFDQKFNRARTDAELGRTSQQAYLDFLRAEEARLGAIKDRTEQQQAQYDQVQRELQNVNKSLSGMWNLGEIDVPKPYQMRRIIAESVARREAAREAMPDSPFKRFGVAGGLRTTTQTTSNQTVNVTINGNDTNQMKAVLSQYLGPPALQRTSVSTAKV